MSEYPAAAFVVLGLLVGFSLVGGYSFYYDRRLLCAASFGGGLLMIGLVAWLL